MNLQRISDCLQYPMKSESWIIEKFDKLNHSAEPYLLVNANIKNFKYINIQYGWEQGNEILYLIYKAMERLLKEGEYIAYRSDDNFVMLLHSPNWDMSDKAAHEFVHEVFVPLVDEIFELEDERIYKKLYASFGICPIFFKECNYFEALEMAEIFRKEDRGIKYRTFTISYYNKDAMAAFVHKYELGTTTITALQRGEYQVYVQPKVDVKTRKIVGGEALLRRFDSHGNSVPLNEFLPILYEEGYIYKVDWFVFETACNIMSKQLTAGKPLVPISFNVSKDFFYEPLACDNYVVTHQKYNLPQKYIELELMETISLDDTGHMIEVIGHFKRAGFKCALDDFGNGYSSFSVLLNADLDYVKLDRIFFSNPLDDAGRKMLENVIDILKFLNIKIVAEGVETKEYVDYMEQLGCDIIQGYYFYRPMPIAEFMELLDREAENEKRSLTNGE